jgi:hypothetical protein
MTDLQPEDWKARKDRTMAALFADAVLDVEECEWRMNGLTVEVKGRDHDVPFRTNVPSIISAALKARAEVESSGDQLYDLVTTDDVIAMLNLPGSIHIDKLEPGPGDEIDPCWVPRFVLWVADSDQGITVDLAKPTVDQIGRQLWRVLEDPAV